MAVSVVAAVVAVAVVAVVIAVAVSHPLSKLNERKRDLTGCTPRRESFDSHPTPLRPTDYNYNHYYTYLYDYIRRRQMTGFALQPTLCAGTARRPLHLVHRISAERSLYIIVVILHSTVIITIIYKV